MGQARVGTGSLGILSISGHSMIPFGPLAEHTGIPPPQLWISSRPSSLSSAPWAGSGFPCPFSRGLLLPSLSCSREAGQGFVDRKSFLYLSLPSGSPEPARGANGKKWKEWKVEEKIQLLPIPIRKSVKDHPERPHVKAQGKPAPDPLDPPGKVTH